MALGGRWHRRNNIEIIPVLVPTLIADVDGPEWGDFALPGEFLVIEGMRAFKATYEQVQTYFVCDETPELTVAVIGQRDFQ
jgi:hypothetical protein